MITIGKLPTLPSQKKKKSSLIGFFKRRFKLPTLWKFKKRKLGIKFAKGTADKNKKSGSPWTRVDGGGMASIRMPGGSGTVSRSGSRMSGRAPVRTRGGARGIVGTKTK